MSKLVGVLGGLGPAATIDFMSEVLDYTDADRDQDNVDMVVSQRSSTPDRTAAILDENKEDPTAQLCADAVIFGCTELSVLYHELHITDPHVVDSMDTLAKWTVTRAGCKLKKQEF